jgi:deoxyribonuclease-4
MSYIGIHIDSTPSSIIDQIKYYYNKKCKVIQFFVSLNKNSESFYKPIKQICKDLDIKTVVHISYTINIAGDPTKYSWGIRQFIEEIKIADKIGAYAVVIHLGKQLDLPLEIALNNMFINLIKVYNEIKDLDINILLETSTGQGSELCYNIDDLSKFYKKIKRNNFGICLDTCHIFNAGYDIRSVKSVQKYLKEFDEKIGLTEIKLIHLNDSHNELGAKVDRHANIGKGYIGEIGLKQIVMFFSKLGVPILLETPNEYINNDFEKLKKYCIEPYKIKL